MHLIDRSSERHQHIIDEVLMDFLTSLSQDMTKSPVDIKLLSNSVRDGLKQLRCESQISFLSL